VLRVSLWRLLQGILESVIARARQGDVTILYQSFQEAQFEHTEYQDVGSAPEKMESSHSRYSVEVELTWPVSGSMPRRPRAVWSQLLTSEDSTMQVA